MEKWHDIRFKRWEAALLLAFAALLLVAAWAGFRETQLASRVVRIHVLANSDTAEDQRLKLVVRDAVLRQAEGYLAGCTSVEQARERLESRLPQLARVGAETVKRQGYPYPVSVEWGPSYFPTKAFADYALPAGCYQALRVKIGAAKGHNWWCVLFPTLSGEAVTEYSEAALRDGLTEEDVKLISGGDEGYMLRFRCLEWYGALKEALSGGESPEPAAAEG